MTYKERIAITVPNPDANEKTIFNDAADGLLKTKDSSGVVETLATTEGIAATEPKVYIALLTQTSTDAPVATVLKNTLDVDITYAYIDVGLYRLENLDEIAFLPNLKTIITFGQTCNNYDFVTMSYFKFEVFALNLYVNNISTGLGVDGYMSITPIKIEVYP